MGWECDQNHLRAGFSAKHLGIVTVRGIFRELSAQFDMQGDDPTGWSVAAVIDVASLDTNNDIRDRKLKSDEYLDAERYPTITFRSERIAADDFEGWYRVIGPLTLRGVTRDVSIRARMNGEVTDERERLCRGFSGKTTIRCSDFDVHTSGSVFLGEPSGDEVKIELAAKGILRVEGVPEIPHISRRQRAGRTPNLGL
jgi:polyisoprenoid-binding protein YceI